MVGQMGINTKFMSADSFTDYTLQIGQFAVDSYRNELLVANNVKTHTIRGKIWEKREGK